MNNRYNILNSFDEVLAKYMTNCLSWNGCISTHRHPHPPVPLCGGLFFSYDFYWRFRDKKRVSNTTHWFAYAMKMDWKKLSGFLYC
jgi:hypothetical protein